MAARGAAVSEAVCLSAQDVGDELPVSGRAQRGGSERAHPVRVSTSLPHVSPSAPVRLPGRSRYCRQVRQGAGLDFARYFGTAVGGSATTRVAYRRPPIGKPGEAIFSPNAEGLLLPSGGMNSN